MKRIVTDWSPAGRCGFCDTAATKEEPLFLLTIRDNCSAFCRQCLWQFQEEVVRDALRDALPSYMTTRKPIP